LNRKGEKTKGADDKKGYINCEAKGCNRKNLTASGWRKKLGKKTDVG